MHNIVIKKGVQCSWCQAEKRFGCDGVAIIMRHQYTQRNVVHFCNPEHARLWKLSLGKRFVRWEKKPGSS